MYVKVLGPTNTLFQVGDSVHWGTHSISDGREELGDVLWHKELADVPPLERLHTFNTTGPVGTDAEGNPFWFFRWAYWDTPTGWEGVVTDSDLYVMSDSGQTVDRIR